MENAGRERRGLARRAVRCNATDCRRTPSSPDPAKHVREVPRGPAHSPKVLVLCGPGNNGGDGAVLARHLDGWRFSVRVLWFAQSKLLSGDPAMHWAILQKSGVEQSAWLDDDQRDGGASLPGILSGADWIVDALLGTGLSRPVEGLLRTVIDAINAAGKPVLALDLPSGLDADTGAPLGAAVRASATATFAAPKLGFSATAP